MRELQRSSLIRGPDDVVSSIHHKLGSGRIYPCSEPHTLAFQVGGVLFPVDPRDFGAQALANSVSLCMPNIVATDTPHSSSLYSWRLGRPFLKS